MIVGDDGPNGRPPTPACPINSRQSASRMNWLGTRYASLLHLPACIGNREADTAGPVTSGPCVLFGTGSLEEQLAQENKGLSSHSVTAAQFLQQRMILFPEGTWGTPKRGAQTHQETTAIAVSTQTRLNESSRAVHTLEFASLFRFAHNI